MDKFICFILGVCAGVVGVAAYQTLKEQQGGSKSFDCLEDSIERRLESLERESRLEAVLN